MQIICKQCNKLYNVHPIHSEEFVVANNEKVSRIIFINQKKYLGIKCDKCGCINIEEMH